MITCTPSLFIGEEFEEARLSDLHWRADDVSGAVSVIQAGHSALVATESTARAVLAALGVEEEWAEHQVTLGLRGVQPDG